MGVEFSLMDKCADTEHRLDVLDRLFKVHPGDKKKTQTQVVELSGNTGQISRLCKSSIFTEKQMRDNMLTESCLLRHTERLLPMCFCQPQGFHLCTSAVF